MATQKNQREPFDPEKYETYSESYKIGDVTYTHTKVHRKDPKTDAFVTKAVFIVAVIIVVGFLVMCRIAGV